MADWVLTKGMQNLRDQINAAFPNRDHTSDGTIGDYAHTQEKSGHNPDDTSAHNAEWDGDPDSIPEVRAIDIDSNLGDGISAQTLVNHIVALRPSSVLRYVIYNRRIWEASNNWYSRAYTGASPHTEHIHFSGAYTQASDENTTYDYHLEDLTMPSLDDIANAVWNHEEPDPEPDVTGAQTRRVGGDMRMLEKRRRDMEARINTRIDALSAKLDSIIAKLG